MKVRLKHDYLNQPVRKTEFQFHEGPIKTNGEKNSRGEWVSFNSMKVRLKQKLPKVSYNPAMFQFHEGPIKTDLTAYGLIRFAVSIP